MHFHYSQLSLPVFWCSTFFGTTYDSHGCKSLWNSAFLLFLLILVFLFESCSCLCFFLRFSSWWRIVEVLPLQKAVQETQRLILQVWTPVPTSIPQDDAFPCQMCVGVQPFLEPHIFMWLQIFVKLGVCFFSSFCFSCSSSNLVFLCVSFFRSSSYWMMTNLWGSAIAEGSAGDTKVDSTGLDPSSD